LPRHATDATASRKRTAWIYSLDEHIELAALERRELDEDLDEVRATVARWRASRA
jgi:hypothetical protein